MIPRDKRFTVRMFQKVFEKSHRWGIDKHLFLIGKTSSQPRFAVVVGKKISKQAVVRNRLRRQIYEMIRRDFLDRNKKWNIIFLYRGGDVIDDITSIKAPFDALFQRLERSHS